MSHSWLEEAEKAQGVVDDGHGVASSSEGASAKVEEV